MGFDGAFAYAKLDPKNITTNLSSDRVTSGAFVQETDNSAADARTNNYGHKAAVLTAYELGYSFDLSGIGPIHVNGEMAESKDYRNDGSKSKIYGARIAHDFGAIKLFGKYQRQSFKGFKTNVFNCDTYDNVYYTHTLNDKAVPKKINTFVIGAYYQF